MRIFLIMRRILAVPVIIRRLMIALRQLTFARAGRPLVVDASLQLHTGWKVGVVGANGSGKSSLFALVAGELHAEAGDLELPAMTLVYKIDSALLANIKPGDKVKFTAKREGGDYVVTKISK